MGTLTDWLADCVYLDTETTGLDDDDIALEVGVVDRDGRELFQSYIKPDDPSFFDQREGLNETAWRSDYELEEAEEYGEEIEPSFKYARGYAERIHGIKKEVVMSEGRYMHEIQGELEEVLRGKNVVIYNADFDIRIMSQTGFSIMKNSRRIFCAMLAYSDYSNKRRWNDYYKNWKWRKLKDAYHECGGTKLQTHRAVTDCQMTHLVWNTIIHRIGINITPVEFLSLGEFLRNVSFKHNFWKPDVIKYDSMSEAPF